MKYREIMKIEEKARSELVALLSRIDAVRIADIEAEPAGADRGVEFVIELEHARKKILSRL